MTQGLSRSRRAVSAYLSDDAERRVHAAYHAAHAEMRRYADAALRIGSSRTVHAIRWRTDTFGLPRAAPACHVGHSHPDGDAELRPVRDTRVTCELCRSRPIAREYGQPYTPDRGQYALDFAAELGELAESYPPPE